MKTCNLCGMVFDELDSLYNLRIIRHKEWHNDPKHLRNSIHGTVRML
jgi:hypothetical protein